MAPVVRRGHRYVIAKDDGRWPARHTVGLDPGLAGVWAFEHPSVKAWWRWLLEEYKPEGSVALVTPCSSVKPYTRSPTSRKIRGLLRRLGLWDPGADGPAGIEWLYLSDLLLLVPYERAEEYPACCYEVHPDTVLENPVLLSRVAGLLATAMERLVDMGLEKAILFLPRKHFRLWSEARKLAAKWPRETLVKYTIFGLGELPSVLNDLRMAPELQELL